MGDDEAEAGKAAGYEVGGARGESCWSGRGFADCGRYDLTRIEDDFANVARLSHETEGVGGARDGKRFAGEGGKAACAEFLAEGVKECLHGERLLNHYLAHVDDVDRRVAAQMAQADGRVGKDVALADLEETAAGREDGETFLDGFTGEGVED